MFIFIKANDACLLERPFDVDQGSLAWLPRTPLKISERSFCDSRRRGELLTRPTEKRACRLTLCSR